MKKIFSVIIFIITVTAILTNCTDNNQNITTFSSDSQKAFAYDSEISILMSAQVYHDNKYVSKSIVTQKCTLKDGNKEDLVKYAESTEKMFKDERFNVDGFSSTLVQSEDSFTMTLIYDFTKMNLKQINKSGNDLLSLKKIIDENYKVPYETLKEEYIESGLKCNTENE